MATRQKLIHLNNAGLNAVPTKESIEFGEIAVNYHNDSANLYIKKANGTMAKFPNSNGTIANATNASKASSIATEVGTSNADRPVFFGYNGNNNKVVYSDKFKYNPYGNGILKVGSLYFPNPNGEADLIKGYYNGNYYDILHTHNNGNVSINAESGGVYFGQHNTKLINFKPYITADSSITASGEIKGTSITASAGYITGKLSGKKIQIGPQNESYTHYSTDALSGHWFNKNVYVTGEIYAGEKYNKKVWHSGNLTPGDYLAKSGGTMTGAITMENDIIMSSGKKIFTSNNYGILGKMTNGSSDYMLYMDSNNRTHISYSGRETYVDAGISASGFTKRNSNDNFVLTGGGGHKEISKLNVDYSNSSGYASKAGTAQKSESMGEAKLYWGGKNFSGSYGPIDAAMIPELGANRIAFLNPNGITIEYSTDGGKTWVNYGASDFQKISLVSGISAGFTVGKKSTPVTANDKLRITINTSVGGVYTVLNKFAIYVSTSGSYNNTCTIQKSLGIKTENYVTVTDKQSVSGWSGWNIINTDGIVTYGYDEKTHYGRIRFIFETTGNTGKEYSGLTVFKIMAFGGQGWTTPSNMAATGHIYSYDASQNSYFPAGISENGKFLSEKYFSINGGKVNGVVYSDSYNKIGNNSASFIFDKLGSNLTGIGPCGETDTIKFGACGTGGGWIDGTKQIWKFNGKVKADEFVIDAGTYDPV